METGLPHELRRYVFCGPEPGIGALAAGIDDPRVLLKLCGPATVLGALLPAGWTARHGGFVMTCDGAHSGPPPTLPVGYRLQIEHKGPVVIARILATDGQVAASGRAAPHGGVFVYDQIVTEAAHQRRGLGRAVMKALEAAGRRAGDLQVLVATEDGRALYAALGWRVCSLYSTGTLATKAKSS